MAIAHQVVYLSENQFEVNNDYEGQFVVDLNKKRVVHVGNKGLPCSYSMVVIISRDYKPT